MQAGWPHPWRQGMSTVAGPSPLHCASEIEVHWNRSEKVCRWARWPLRVDDESEKSCPLWRVMDCRGPRAGLAQRKTDSFSSPHFCCALLCIGSNAKTRGPRAEQRFRWARRAAHTRRGYSCYIYHRQLTDKGDFGEVPPQHTKFTNARS